MRVKHKVTGNESNAYPWYGTEWYVEETKDIAYRTKADMLYEWEDIDGTPLKDYTEKDLNVVKTQSPVFSGNAEERNAIPLADGLLYYFPNALAAVAAVSVAGNKQHNLGPLHWDRSKSTNHADKILRHQVDAGTMDTDGTRHSAKVAWRALAQLEDELIEAGATPGKNARNSPNKEGSIERNDTDTVEQQRVSCCQENVCTPTQSRGC